MIENLRESLTKIMIIKISLNLNPLKLYKIVILKYKRYANKLGQ